MAEVLGIVASGIAVAQITQTLGGLVVSMHRLWMEVKDVPETIQDLLEELNCVEALVTAAETALASSLGPGSSTIPSTQQLAIERCRRFHKDLSCLIADLSADITSSRKRKRLVATTRVALQKETLEKYERRLRKALRLVDTVVLLSLTSSLAQQPKLIVANLTDALTSKQPLPAIQLSSDAPADEEAAAASNKDRSETLGSPLTRPAASQDNVSRRRKGRGSRTMFSRLGLEITEVEDQSDPSGYFPPTKSYRVRISSLSWLLSKAWDINMSMACSGWTFHARQYVLVPYDSLVVRTIYAGTLGELLELFREGHASPFSMEENGSTLLHVAMTCCRWEFIQPLVQMGLDLHMEDSHGLLPWHRYVLACSWNLPSRSRQAELEKLFNRRLITSHDDYDDLSSVDPWSDWRRGENANATVQLLRQKGVSFLLLTQSVETFELFKEHLFPGLYQIPLQVRLYVAAFAMMVLRGVSGDARALARFFHDDGCFRAEDLQHPLSLGGTFLAAFSHAYFTIGGGTFRRRFRDTPIYQDARSILRAMAPLLQTNKLSNPRLNTSLISSILAVRRHGEHCDGGCDNTWCLRVSYYSDKEIDAVYVQGIRKLLRDWVEDLKGAGHDLEAYGQAEMAAFRHNTWAQSMAWPPQLQDPERSCRRWKGFQYGPNPVDWDLIWEVELDAVPSALEEPIMPGAWVDDE